MEQKAYLILEDGHVFPGQSFGADSDAIGELVFTTAMTGYLETLTDPSYYGQLVMQTFPLIGNYGVIPADFERETPHLFGYIVRSWCQSPSNFRNEGDLDTFLKMRGIPGLYGVDTRRLTRIVREQGVMNAAIVHSVPTDLSAFLQQLKEYRVKDALAGASGTPLAPRKPEFPKRRVVLWDFGAKENIARELCKRGCEVIPMPYTASSGDILALAPDGVMLSNGPGDPAENETVIAELKQLCESRIPIFGICLGHQLLALSQGARTKKLKYGHRGANQPVKDCETGRVYITSQNHGYVVEGNSLPPFAREGFVNGNDGTNEGVSYQNMPAFSVQFHPEACGGPLDTTFLFDRFIGMMDREKDAKTGGCKECR